MNKQSSTEQAIYSKKSNEQRLKSLDQYEEERQQRRRLIKDSLNDTNAKKHVKFDSDDDDDTHGKEFVPKKMQLFDNNDEGVNVEEHFNPSKATKKKRKLKALQATISNTTDPRFQLSEQFLDDDQRGDHDDNEHEDDKEQHEEISMEEEKKKSLAILDQITNAKPSSSSATGTKSKSKMIRFDPSKTEHRIYELDAEVPVNGSHPSPLKDTPTKSILKATPVVDTTRVYELDKSRLKSIFDKSTKPVETAAEPAQFQFQFFHNDPTPKPIVNGEAKKLTVNIHDSSSEDEDHPEDEKASSVNGVEVEEEPVQNQTFFFFDLDRRLKNGLETFVRTEDLNELERTWPTKRKEIGEALRTKHRKAIQRRDKYRISQRRRRQTTNSA